MWCWFSAWFERKGGPSVQGDISDCATQDHEISSLACRQVRSLLLLLRISRLSANTVPPVESVKSHPSVALRWCRKWRTGVRRSTAGWTNGGGCSARFAAGFMPIPSPAGRSTRRPGSWRKSWTRRGIPHVDRADGTRAHRGTRRGCRRRASSLFRADIDALRIHDAKTVPYRSTRDGVMHACGHDAHATMALGAALALWQCRDSLARRA